MGQQIKVFSNKSYLEYDRGNFDNWCVYFTEANGRRTPPRDTDYFDKLRTYSIKYGVDKIYNDYVKIYELTGKQVEGAVLNTITSIAYTYGDDSLEIDIIYSILYLAMIAEEQKANTRLGKKIKRLGIHVLLKENRDVEEAANFMRGMGWRDILALCVARGF